LITVSHYCESLMPTIITNCKFHPNDLLACNDTRFAQYPLILKQAQEEQKKAEELQIRDLKSNFSSKLKENAASLIISRCTNNSTATSSYHAEMRSLQNDCGVASWPYNYCKSEQFVSYLNQKRVDQMI